MVVFRLRAERHCNRCGAYVGNIPYGCACPILSRWFLIYLAQWLRSLIKPYRKEISSINCDKCARLKGSG